MTNIALHLQLSDERMLAETSVNNVLPLGNTMKKTVSEIDTVKSYDSDHSSIGAKSASSSVVVRLVRSSLQDDAENNYYDDENDTTITMKPQQQPQCDACIYCNDCCENTDCIPCQNRRNVLPQHCAPCNSSEEKYFTPCQIRRHNHEKSAWLVAGDTIYDATPYLIMGAHPGGRESILSRAGGVKDCTRDLHFHSSHGKRMFHKYQIGKVRPCPGGRGGCSSTVGPAAKNTVTSTDPRGHNNAKQWWSLLF